MGVLVSYVVSLARRRMGVLVSRGEEWVSWFPRPEEKNGCPGFLAQAIGIFVGYGAVNQHRRKHSNQVHRCRKKLLNYPYDSAPEKNAARSYPIRMMAIKPTLVRITV
jgi:hypothetical protein